MADLFQRLSRLIECGINLAHDPFGGQKRIDVIDDRPSDYQIIRACADSFSGSGQSLLIVRRCAQWSHAWSHNQEILLRNCRSDWCYFERRGNNAIETARCCELRERGYLLF